MPWYKADYITEEKAPDGVAYRIRVYVLGRGVREVVIVRQKDRKRVFVTEYHGCYQSVQAFEFAWEEFLQGYEAFTED